ncbi:MAG: hypothetical protein AAF741_00145 [Bacteroidota bacterium]
MEAKLKEIPADYFVQVTGANVTSCVSNILLVLAVTWLSDYSEAQWYMFGAVIVLQVLATYLLIKKFKSNLSRFLRVSESQIILENQKREVIQTFDLDEIELLTWSDHIRPISKRTQPWWKYPFYKMQSPWLSFKTDGEEYLYHFIPDSEYMRDRLERVLTAWEKKQINSGASY